MIEISKEEYIEFLRSKEIIDTLVELSETHDVIITSLNANVTLEKSDCVSSSGQTDLILTGYRTKTRIGDFTVTKKSSYLTGKSLRSVLQIK
jgi:hypothetical protein